MRFNPPDLAKLVIKPAVPLPPTRGGNGDRFSTYRELLSRMKPNDMVELSPPQAKAMVAIARKRGIKTALRQLSNDVCGVWRLA